MADVQIAVIDQQNTQIVGAVPGVQGAAGISDYSTIAGTTYTLTDADRSKILVFTNASPVTLTVPSGLATVFDVMIVQSGAGQITVSAGAGVTINAALSATKTAYQYAVATHCRLALIPSSSPVR
jgi:hypothetical protein